MTPEQEDALVESSKIGATERHGTIAAWLNWEDAIRLAIRAAVQMERERCAKVIEQYSVEIAGIPHTSRNLKPMADDIRKGD